MPFYYSAALYGLTTNVTAGAETDHLQLLTGAGAAAMLSGLFAVGRNVTVGGGGIRVRRYATISTGGTPVTPRPANPRSPAAATAANSGPTAGATATDLMEMAVSQTGGGGWTALEPDDAFEMSPGGGANGNIDLLSVMASASMTIDLTAKFSE